MCSLLTSVFFLSIFSLQMTCRSTERKTSKVAKFLNKIQRISGRKCHYISICLVLNLSCFVHINHINHHLQSFLYSIAYHFFPLTICVTWDVSLERITSISSFSSSSSFFFSSFFMSHSAELHRVISEFISPACVE